MRFHSKWDRLGYGHQSGSPIFFHFIPLCGVHFYFERIVKDPLPGFFFISITDNHCQSLTSLSRFLIQHPRVVKILLLLMKLMIFLILWQRAINILLFLMEIDDGFACKLEVKSAIRSCLSQVERFIVGIFVGQFHCTRWNSCLQRMY